MAAIAYQRRSTTTPSRNLQDGDNAGAEQGFETFLQSNPKHVLAGNAQYWLGESYYARKDYQNAMTAFAEGYKNYKTSPKGPDNLLKLGLTLAVMRPQEAGRLPGLLQASARTIRAPPTCRNAASTRSARRTAAGDASGRRGPRSRSSSDWLAELRGSALP